MTPLFPTTNIDPASKNPLHSPHTKNIKGKNALGFFVSRTESERVLPPPRIESNDVKEAKEGVELVQPLLLVHDGDASPRLPRSVVDVGTTSLALASAIVPRIVSYNVNGLSNYACNSGALHRKHMAYNAIAFFFFF